jgi:mannose-6-phosphate isomerase-like protein (cupin superfamily)
MILSREKLEKLAIGRKMDASQVMSGFAMEEGGVKLDSMDDLRALSDRLILPMDQVLEAVDSDLDDGVKVCRKAEGFVRTSERNGNRYYTYQHLATSKAAPELMALRVTVHCNSDDQVVLNGGHGSKEIVYITKGPIRMDWQALGQLRQVDLREGDSVFLSPNVSHSFRALGSQDAELLAFNY